MAHSAADGCTIITFPVSGFLLAFLLVCGTRIFHFARHFGFGNDLLQSSFTTFDFPVDETAEADGRIARRRVRTIHFGSWDFAFSAFSTTFSPSRLSTPIVWLGFKKKFKCSASKPTGRFVAWADRGSVGIQGSEDDGSRNLSQSTDWKGAAIGFASVASVFKGARASTATSMPLYTHPTDTHGHQCTSSRVRFRHGEIAGVLSESYCYWVRSWDHKCDLESKSEQLNALLQTLAVGLALSIKSMRWCWKRKWRPSRVRCFVISVVLNGLWNEWDLCTCSKV